MGVLVISSLLLGSLLWCKGLGSRGLMVQGSGVIVAVSCDNAKALYSERSSG